MKIAYFDCFTGAGGDMIVASMLDAGLDSKFLKAQLATLEIKNLDIEIAETNRAGLRALCFKPIAPEHKENRNLDDIKKIITQSRISKQAKQIAITIFEKLAKAEAAVHGKAPADVHFHETGAIDSIVDIVSASVGIEALELEKIYCSALSVGGGSINCTHGLLPVPAPATAELLKGIPIVAGPVQAELLTPTAAAILTTIVDEFTPLPAMKIERTGYGAGSMDSKEFPNVLRLIIGQACPSESENADSVCLLETNIDDTTGEILGFITESLLNSGALDVFTIPIYMKHNRPAVKLSVLCRIGDTQQIEQFLFEEGVTFGIRKQIVQRAKLVKHFTAVQTPFGEIKIKTGSLNEKVVNAKPEFADCAAAAKKHNVTIKQVLDAAILAYKDTDKSVQS